MAALLYFGQAFLEEYSETAIANPEVLSLASRVYRISDPEIDRRWPQEEPSEVTLQLKDGSEYTAAINFAKGSLGNPMTEDELKDKFRILAGGVLTKTSIERIIDMVANLENLSNIRDLIEVIYNGRSDCARPVKKT
jgi:2-methylcitrate dehydratase PrpD